MAKPWQETVLFVGNIPFAAEEDDLRDVFTQAGHQVSTVKIARDADSHRSRGFGFVTALTDRAEDLVKEMYGAECCGRNLRVAISTSEITGNKGPRLTQKKTVEFDEDAARTPRVSNRFNVSRSRIEHWERKTSDLQRDDTDE